MSTQHMRKVWAIARELLYLLARLFSTCPAHQGRARSAGRKRQHHSTVLSAASCRACTCIRGRAARRVNRCGWALAQAGTHPTNGFGAEVSGVAHGESSAGCLVHISSKLATQLQEQTSET